MIVKNPVKIIICGSRSFDDHNMLEKTIREIFRNLAQKDILYGSIVKDKELIEIISGGAEGADLIGEWFAQQYELNTKVMFADWEHNGEQAGFIRNCEMVDYVADCMKEQNSYGLVIAFWDGQSKGTQHCFNYAKNKHLDVIIKLF